MEGIELRARRVAFGLSVAEAARLCEHSAKHWRDWEAGRRPVPDSVADAMRALSHQYEEAIWKALQLADARGDTDEPIPLFAFKTIEAFENAGGEDHYGLPWSGHTALVGLTLISLELDEIPAYIHGIHR